MQSINEETFAFIACLCKFFDLLKIFLWIQLSPLFVVVRIVFRCEHILIHLDLAAEFHQINTVFQ